jgi:hypothetical protein
MLVVNKTAATQLPKTVFLLGNGRSGTRFLCGLFRNNAKDCAAVHEPYLRAGAPSMFGPPIYDYTHGRHDRVREAFARKLRGILSYRSQWYVETNHAFLKSFADAAMEVFPDMKLVHVVRNPMQACASQANREEFIHRWHTPFRFYSAENGRRYYRWRLTGDEPIYQHFGAARLSLFQKFFIQWIEIENRAQQFLDRHDKRGDCFLLHTPGDLNDADKIRRMFEFFEMPLKQGSVVLDGVRNRTPGKQPGATNERLLSEAREVIERLPVEHLDIFRSSPYADYSWSAVLRK